MSNEDIPEKNNPPTQAPAAIPKKPLNKRALTLNLALLLTVLFLGYVFTHYADKGAMPITRMQPPDIVGPVTPFDFTDLNGKSRNLKDFTGKIVLINFWATWCAPCLQEFPKLMDLAAANKDNVIFLALSADIEEEHIRTFLKRQEIPPANFIIAWDKDDIAHSTFGISKLPETVIVDKDTNERTRVIGSMWESRDVQQIINALQQPRPAQTQESP